MGLTLIEIKRIIYKKRGHVSAKLRATLIANAEECYTEAKVKHPVACAVSFVNSTIQNAKYR